MARDHDTPRGGGAIHPVDPYLLPELYELDHAAVDEDLAHYEALARAARLPVLELAAGTGRLTLPMARAGAVVHAVDQSGPMLEVLRRRLAREPGLRVSIEQGDLRDLRTAAGHDLIVLAFNALQHLLDPGEVTAFFRAARRAVVPGGRLALDTYLPHERLTEALDGTPDTVTHLDSRTGRVWRSTQHTRVEEGGTLLITETEWSARDGARHRTRMVQRLYPLPWLVEAAGAAGWEVERSWGDFEGGAVEDGAVKWVGVLI